MIIVLICVVATIIGWVMYRKNDPWETVSTVGLCIFVCGIIALVFAISGIIGNHIGVSVRIKQDNIRYESLCERNKIIESQYEDVSKSDIIKDIAEWNKEVINYQYWAYNPWTNWFYVKSIADNMKIIETNSD